MEKINFSDRLQTLQNAPHDEKVKFEYQAIGKEVEAFLKPSQKEKRSLWASFYKFPCNKHREALVICQRNGVASFRYFMGVLNNIK